MNRSEFVVVCSNLEGDCMAVYVIGVCRCREALFSPKKFIASMGQWAPAKNAVELFRWLARERYAET